ncbi:MAG TPA: glycosyltransferase family 2 protein [Saprospiraceae bacterium]|nr:glycosyltransferase family 2 protein [Saprospiraceae bacterium]
MEVSVIIPVYNAEEFVEKAVLSALAQKETSEVLLIDDASTDNSRTICLELAQKYKKIKFFCHKDGENHGPGATRNIGISNAQYDYIAFLDADDFYAPDIFKYAAHVFNEQLNADGVYGVLKNYFYSPEIEDYYLNKMSLPEYYKMNRYIKPANLLEALLCGDSGYFSIVSMVIKKDFLITCGLFFENIRLAEDIDLIYRMCVLGRLLPSNLNEVIVFRGVHGGNITFGSHYKARRWLYETWLENVVKYKLNIYVCKRFLLLRASQFKSSVLFQKYRAVWLTMMVLNCIRVLIAKPKLLVYTFRLWINHSRKNESNKPVSVPE